MPSVWCWRAWIISRLWKLSQSQTVSCPGLLLAEKIAHPSSIIPSGLNIYTEGEQHHLSTTHSFTEGRATSRSGVRVIRSVRNITSSCWYLPRYALRKQSCTNSKTRWAFPSMFSEWSSLCIRLGGILPTVSGLFYYFFVAFHFWKSRTTT